MPRLSPIWVGWQCEVTVIPSMDMKAEEKEEIKKQQLYQRLKGWVLIHTKGWVFVTLRDDHINFYESRLIL